MYYRLDGVKDACSYASWWPISSVIAACGIYVVPKWPANIQIASRSRNSAGPREVFRPWHQWSLHLPLDPGSRAVPETRAPRYRSSPNKLSPGHGPFNLGPYGAKNIQKHGGFQGGCYQNLQPKTAYASRLFLCLGLVMSSFFHSVWPSCRVENHWAALVQQERCPVSWPADVQIWKKRKQKTTNHWKEVNKQNDKKINRYCLQPSFFLLPWRVHESTSSANPKFQAQLKGWDPKSCCFHRLAQDPITNRPGPCVAYSPQFEDHCSTKTVDTNLLNKFRDQCRLSMQKKRKQSEKELWVWSQWRFADWQNSWGSWSSKSGPPCPALYTPGPGRLSGCQAGWRTNTA